MHILVEAVFPSTVVDVKPCDTTVPENFEEEIVEFVEVAVDIIVEELADSLLPIGDDVVSVVDVVVAVKVKKENLPSLTS